LSHVQVLQVSHSPLHPRPLRAFFLLVSSHSPPSFHLSKSSPATLRRAPTLRVAPLSQVLVAKLLTRCTIYCFYRHAPFLHIDDVSIPCAERTQPFLFLPEACYILRMCRPFLCWAAVQVKVLSKGGFKFVPDYHIFLRPLSCKEAGLRAQEVFSAPPR